MNSMSPRRRDSNVSRVPRIDSRRFLRASLSVMRSVLVIS